MLTMTKPQKVANWQLFHANVVFGPLPKIERMYNYSDGHRMLHAWPLARISQSFGVTHNSASLGATFMVARLAYNWP